MFFAPDRALTTRPVRSPLAVFVATALAATAAHATDYYVGPSGSDSNPGTAGAPFATLQHAADQLSAGDTMTVLPGTYAGFSLGWNNPQNGTASQPIVITAMPGVIINAPNSNTADGIDLEATSFVVVDGFEVTGAGRAGIRAVSDGTTNADGVIIRNNYCHDNTVWGIFTSHEDNIVVQSNRASNSAMQHGIYISNASVGPIVRGNTIWGNSGAGIHMNGDASQGGTGVITNALVEQNIIYENGLGGGSGINCDGLQQSTIRNNLIYAEHASGISLYQIDAAMPAIDNVIVNNTVIVASDGRWALNIQNASTGNTAYNNILLNLNPSHGSIDTSTDSLSGFVSDYNVVMDLFTPDDSTFVTFAQWQSQTGQDAHSIIATSSALFVNTSSNDYHLATGSPAIAAGTSMDMPPVDLEGTTRTAADIGAYAYNGVRGDAGTPDAAVDSGPSNDSGPIDSGVAHDGGDATVPTDAVVTDAARVDAHADSSSSSDVVHAADDSIDHFVGNEAGFSADDFFEAGVDAGNGHMQRGCACRTVPTSPRVPWPAVLFGVAVVLRRRRSAAKGAAPARGLNSRG